MHAQFPVAVVELAQADGVVVVLGVIGVDRADDLVGQIEARLRLFAWDRNVSTASRACCQHFLGKSPRQIELNDDALEIDIFLPGLAEHFGDDALRPLAVFGILVSSTTTFVPGFDVPRGGVGGEDRLGERVAVRAARSTRSPLLRERADESLLRALEDLGDRPLYIVLPSRCPRLVILARTMSPVIAPPFCPSGMNRSSWLAGSVGTTNPKPRLLCR